MRYKAGDIVGWTKDNTITDRVIEINERGHYLLEEIRSGWKWECAPQDFEKASYLIFDPNDVLKAML